MKKLVSVVLLCVMLFLVVGCDGTHEILDDDNIIENTLDFRVRELARESEMNWDEWIDRWGYTDLSEGTELFFDEPWDIYDTIIINGELIDERLVWLHNTRTFRGDWDSQIITQWGYRATLAIPLIAVAEALGYDVTWNDEYQRMIITATDGEEYIFWIGLKGVYNESHVARWERLIHLEAEPIIIDDTFFVPVSFFPAHVFERQLMIGGYWKNRAAGIVISSAYMTEDEISAEFATYVRFEDPVMPQAPTLVIVPDIPLRDFWWFELRQSQSENFYFYVGETLSAPGDITQERPFVVNWGHLGTMPYRGISFLDEDGERRYFVINDNQGDFGEGSGGFVNIYEFTHGVSPW